MIQPSSYQFKMPCGVLYERFYRYVTRNTKLHITRKFYVGMKLVLTCIKHMYITKIGTLKHTQSFQFIMLLNLFSGLEKHRRDIYKSNL